MDSLSERAEFSLQTTAAGSKSALTLSPRPRRGDDDGAVRIKLCAWIDGAGRFERWIGADALKAGFGPGVDNQHSDFSNGHVALLQESLRLDDIASAVLVFEAGADAGVVECCLKNHRHIVDLYRPRPGFVVVRMDPSATCDLRNIWDPLELHVIGDANRAAQGTQCVISAVYTDYPRRRSSPGSINRLKFPESNWEWGDNGDAIVNYGACVFSNPQRTALEIVCHDWGGLIVLRRGPLLNAADLYAKDRCKGLILSESCDIAIGRNTGLGIGEAPMFGAFVDMFNP